MVAHYNNNVHGQSGSTVPKFPGSDILVPHGHGPEVSCDMPQDIQKSVSFLSSSHRGAVKVDRPGMKGLRYVTRPKKSSCSASVQPCMVMSPAIPIHPWHSSRI